LIDKTTGNALYLSSAAEVDAATIESETWGNSITDNNTITTNRSQSRRTATAAQGFSANQALPLSDTLPLVLTESEFDSLSHYEPRLYHVLNVGTYYGSTIIQRVPWTYGASDLHVMKTGDDGTGDGSFGNPYLTISEAVDQASAAGGITIWVHEGTYAENDGSGYFLQSNESFTSTLTIAAVPGDRVVWTAASGAYLARFNSTNANIRIKGMVFVPIAATTSIIFAGSASFDGFEIVECIFLDDSDTVNMVQVNNATSVSSDFKFLRNVIETNGEQCLYLGKMNGAHIVGNAYRGTAADSLFIEFQDDLAGTFYIGSNTINTPSAGNTVSAIAQTAPSTINTSTVFDLRSNRIETTGRAMRIIGGLSGFEITFNLYDNYIRSGALGVYTQQYIDSGTIQGNDILAGTITASSQAIGLPSDGGSQQLVEGLIITGNRFESVSGHAFLVSYESDGHTISDNLIYANSGGDHAAVIKGANHTLTGNTIYGGSATALYLKGANTVSATDNYLVQVVAGGSAIEFGEESLSATPDPVDCDVINNLVEVTNGRVIEVASAEISTGNTVDENAYLVSGSGAWGTMFGSSVGSLAAVQSSWAANYDQTTNDANSVDR
jgi:hypothetical protein